jgi:hypothetical protein
VTRGAAACEAEVRWRERAVGMMRGWQHERGGARGTSEAKREICHKNESSIETLDLDHLT